MQNRSWQVIGSSQRWHHDLAMVARPAAKIRTCCISACPQMYEQDVWGASAAGLREGLRMCVSRLRDCIGMLKEMHAAPGHWHWSGRGWPLCTCSLPQATPQNSQNPGQQLQRHQGRRPPAWLTEVLKGAIVQSTQVAVR